MRKYFIVPTNLYILINGYMGFYYGVITYRYIIFNNTKRSDFYIITNINTFTNNRRFMYIGFQNNLPYYFLSKAPTVNLPVVQIFPSTVTFPFNFKIIPFFIFFSCTISTSKDIESPGFICFLNLVLSIPMKRVSFSFLSNSLPLYNKIADAWAIASTVRTPGKIGFPGKCPWKIGSLKVTFFLAITLFSVTSSILSINNIG